MSPTQYRALSWLASGPTFSKTNLWAWGIGASTWDSLVRHGWVERDVKPGEVLPIWKVTHEGKAALRAYKS